MTDKRKNKCQPTGDYETGYCRPPKSGQIQKGEVRNPYGARGKAGTTSPKPWQHPTAALLQKELDRRIPIREGNTVRKISARGALLRKLTNDALKGDRHAQKFILSLVVADEKRAADQREQLLETLMEAITQRETQKREYPETELPASAIDLDHVKIDMETGDISFEPETIDPDGPLGRLLEKMAYEEREIATSRERVKADPGDEAAKELLQDLIAARDEDLAFLKKHALSLDKIRRGVRAWKQQNKSQNGNKRR